MIGGRSYLCELNRKRLVFLCVILVLILIGALGNLWALPLLLEIQGIALLLLFGFVFVLAFDCDLNERERETVEKAWKRVSLWC